MLVFGREIIFQRKRKMTRILSHSRFLIVEAEFGVERQNRSKDFYEFRKALNMVARETFFGVLKSSVWEAEVSLVLPEAVVRCCCCCRCWCGGFCCLGVLSSSKTSTLSTLTGSEYRRCCWSDDDDTESSALAVLRLLVGLTLFDPKF